MVLMLDELIENNPEALCDVGCGKELDYDGISDEEYEGLDAAQATVQLLSESRDAELRPCSRVGIRAGALSKPSSVTQ